MSPLPKNKQLVTALQSLFVVVNLLNFATLRDQISRSEQDVISENIFSYEDDLYNKDVILSSKSKGYPAFLHHSLDGRNSSMHRVANTSEKMESMLVVVLGMHRSGTSMLTGLLIETGVLDGGTNLKPSSKYNQKGYFEDINLVNQNMILLRDQKIDPILTTSPRGDVYNTSLAFERINKGNVKCMYGSEFLGNMTRNGVQPSASLPKAVRSLAKPDEAEVGKKALIVKDPCMCITLPTWLKFWQKENPVILYTFRNPVEVARSIVRRDRIAFDSALRSWILHNKYVILSSANLCLIPTDYASLMDNTLYEVNRIVGQLSNVCGVVTSATHSNGTVIKQEVIGNFVDSTLRHNKDHNSSQCTLNDYGLGDYKIKSLQLGLKNRQLLESESLYLEAMKIFCDIKSGDALGSNYEWPSALRLSKV